MINLEPNSNTCEHCGEILHYYDNITIRNNKIYHTECLPENLKSFDEDTIVSSPD